MLLGVVLAFINLAKILGDLVAFLLDESQVPICLFRLIKKFSVLPALFFVSEFLFA